MDRLSDEEFYRLLETTVRDTCTRITDRKSLGFTQVLVYLDRDYADRRTIASIEITDENSIYKNYKEVIHEIVSRHTYPRAVFLICNSDIEGGKGEAMIVTGLTEDGRSNMSVIPILRDTRQHILVDTAWDIRNFTDISVKSQILETFFLLWKHEKKK